MFGPLTRAGVELLASTPSLPAAMANLIPLAAASLTAFSSVAFEPEPPRLMLAASPDAPLAAT